MRSKFLVLFGVLALAACGEAATEQEKSDGEPSAAPALGGKADVSDVVQMGDALTLGEEGATSSEFTEDFQYHAFELDVPAGSVVDLEVSQRGTSRGLDTVLWVFGPRTEAGGYGFRHLAFDDDEGWGLLSRLRGLELTEGGRYLAVVGTYDGYGRGRFRVEAECASGGCLSAPDPLADVCVFGEAYYQVFENNPAIVVTGERTIRSPDEVSELLGRQILEAVKRTAYDEVTTLAEALDTVDEGIANVHDLWDASSRRGFVSVEVGAGDNSFGAIFPADSDAPVVEIVDGDFYSCDAFWGKERRACAASSDCAAGLRCEGVFEGQGLCLDPSAPAPRGTEAPCAGDLGCGVGLVCAGSATGGEGACMPAELRATFGGEDFNVAIPDGGEVEVPLDTFGLASVHTDVVLNLWVSHRRAEDLQIVLTNPSGTEVVVSDKVAGSGVYLRDVGLLGFPGDEDANGRWTLTLRDTKAGESGTLRGFSLQVTSRWD
jgi:hypothetical protein